MTAKIISEFEKGLTEVIRVRLSEFKGNLYFDVRVWIKGEGGVRPTKKGLCLNVELLDDLKQALEKVGMVIEGQGEDFPGPDVGGENG